jgi:serine/threonine protein kinase
MTDRGPAHKAPDESARIVSGEQATMAAATPAPAVSGSAHASVKPPADWVGREIAARYRVVRRIGEGGMGVVYEAEHLHLMKRVALKVIHPELARHEELLLRFKREALATGQLDHPHIAAAIDFGELEGGGAFIVMPLVRGVSLQSELERSQPMELRRLSLLGSQIADALSAAHAVGIVHRDLKPDNVLLETRGDGSESAKVLDFGVASLAGQGLDTNTLAARPLTQAGTILGTPGYMSPEQATAGEIDQRTDLYALGVMLWELCRGERLFDGDDVTQIFAKQFNQVPPALSLGNSSSARTFSELVQQLLDWDKAKRPSSAADVRDTLRRISELPDLPLRAQSRSANLQKYLPYAVAALSLLIAIVMVSSRDEPEPQPAVEPAPVSPNTSSAHKKDRHVEPAKRETPRVAVGEKQLATELREAQDAMLLGERREVRRAGARKLIEHAAELPRYVVLMAELELATQCVERKDLLAAMRSLGDPRVLPKLERMRDQPRRGCGLLGFSDCLACVRKEIDTSIAELDSIGR